MQNITWLNQCLDCTDSIDMSHLRSKIKSKTFKKKIRVQRGDQNHSREARKRWVKQSKLLVFNIYLHFKFVRDNINIIYFGLIMKTSVNVIIIWKFISGYFHDISWEWFPYCWMTKYKGKQRSVTSISHAWVSKGAIIMLSSLFVLLPFHK